MKILIAPDKFKDSLGARQVAANIAIGLREVLANARIEEVAVADGGEGTAGVISEALDGHWIECDAHDSLGREIKARFAWIEASKLAVVEMSEAAGLRRLASGERDPERSSTFGVGEMLLAAAKQGARETIVGLGGSATNDGGFGLARALGYQFYDGRGRELPGDVTKLIHLEKIALPEERGWSPIIIAADVNNPLLGENGATRVFGAQKGATSDQIRSLEKALSKLATIAAQDLRKDFREIPGAGAAGGLGFGLMTFCSATMRSGFDVVADSIHLEQSIAAADIIVTGEGSLDGQTLDGKVPAGVAKLALKNGKRVFAIVGKSSHDGEIEGLFEKVFTLNAGSISDADSIKRAPELLRLRAKELTAFL